MRLYIIQRLDLCRFYRRCRRNGPHLVTSHLSIAKDIFNTCFLLFFFLQRQFECNNYELSQLISLPRFLLALEKVNE